MKFSAVVFALALCGCAVGQNRPLGKVVKLLREMQDELQVEAKADEETYEKMACWCQDNDREKTQAIKTAESTIKDLRAQIEEAIGKNAKLATEIANLAKEIAANKTALEQATASRKKQLAEFNAEEKDLLQSITALKSAITVLSKHHKDTSLVENAVAMVQHTLNKSNLRNHKKAQSFLQYGPQSGEIFGMLKSMLESFQQNLAGSKQEDSSNEQNYSDLRAAKLAELAAAEEQHDTKSQQKADTDEAKAKAKTDLENTRNSLSADEQFLMDLKEKCSQTDQEWDQRQKTRQDEMLAISQAISILSGDDARDTFNSTFNFIQQRRSSVGRARQEKAASFLEKVGNRLNRPKLTALALKVRLDAFDKVKIMIDEMIENLKNEKTDEIKHKDWCNKSLNENESDTNEKNRQKASLESEIAQTNSELAGLTKQLELLQTELGELSKSKKEAGEDRERQHQEFHKALTEQRATQRIIQQAIETLENFYAKKKTGVALNQQPSGFKTYEKKGGNKVIDMLHQTQNDTHEMELELTRDEQDDQQNYETLVMETNNLLAVKRKQSVEVSANKAEAERVSAQLGSDLDVNATELEDLADQNTNLHSSCDFVLKNFDIRQKGRDEEIESLRQAKAILSGSEASA